MAQHLCYSVIASELLREQHMAEPKDLKQAQADFAAAPLQSVDGMGRVRAEQKLSSIISDLWNGLVVKLRSVPLRCRESTAVEP